MILLIVGLAIITNLGKEREMWYAIKIQQASQQHSPAAIDTKIIPITANTIGTISVISALIIRKRVKS